MAAADEELYSLLVPLREARLLVPRACVAEVVRYQPPAVVEGAPTWLRGLVPWNDRRIPLVAFEDSTAVSGEMIRAFDFWGSMGAAVGVVGVLSVLTYFFFSVEHKGSVGKTARVGIWFLMISFGSAFGLTVMGRITLLLQRFEFLFTDWLGIG